jgi:UDP-N-acetylmuramoyl-L-alanyl-D-glutamate--2,6-diaminopimelate ligase
MSPPLLRLADLAALCGGAATGAAAVAGVTADSRAVRPGDVFFALAGAKVDGASFAAAAVEKGAIAVVGEGGAPPGLPATVPYLRAGDARRVLSLAAAALHGPQPAHVVAITGTAGKTSVADFTRQILAHAGHQAASVGTLGIIGPAGARYGSLTTPDPVTLHRTLAGLAAEGVTHVAMEASSHGLDQRRLDGVALKAAAFTNLGRDHLDYHPDMDSYLAAKLRLFDTLLAPGQPVVLNTEGDYSLAVARACMQRGLRLVTVGSAGADLRLAAVRREGFGQRLRLVAEGEAHDVLLPLIGDFQVENALTAAGLALALGVPVPAILAALGSLAGVPGRLDAVGDKAGAPVFVDYAHKPDALRHVLATLRPFTSGRLVVAFGCGGDRDQGKRPIMGEIASRHADVVIVTDDNPRSEEAACIRRAILAAAPGAREIADRAEAICAGIAMLEPGDVFVIAGKGHEEGQIVRGEVLPFSDHAVAAAALREFQS